MKLNSNKPVIILVALFFVSANMLLAQVSPTKLWDKSFGGDGFDELVALVATQDGGYLLAGTSDSSPSGDKAGSRRGGKDYWVVKINSDGSKGWDRAYGGNMDDILTCVISTPDGGFLLGGYSDSDETVDKSEESRGFSDYWIVKIDSDGNKVWDKTYGGGYIDQLYSLALAPDGGYLLGGSSMSNNLSNPWNATDKTENNKGANDYWIIKINADGTKVWDKTYGGSRFDNLFSIIVANDGGYLLAGTSSSGVEGDKTDVSKGTSDYWVVKINADGSKVWDRAYGGDMHSVLASMISTPDGGYLLGGRSNSGAVNDKTEPAIEGLHDYWVIKINANGSKLWDRTIGSTGSEILTSLAVTVDGGYLLGGYTKAGVGGSKTEASKGNNDYWVVKLTSDGSKVWDKTIGGSRTDNLTTIIAAPEGGHLLGGYSYSGKTGDKVEEGKGESDFWIVKIEEAALLSISERASISIQQVQVYPNPSQGEVNLAIDNIAASAETVNYTLYNSIGQPVLQKKVSADQVKTGVKISTAGFAGGVYYLQVVYGGQVVTKKLISQD